MGGSVESTCLLAGGVMLQKENRYAETKDLFPCSLFRRMEPCYNVAAYPMAYEPFTRAMPDKRAQRPPGLKSQAAQGGANP